MKNKNESFNEDLNVSNRSETVRYQSIIPESVIERMFLEVSMRKPSTSKDGIIDFEESFTPMFEALKVAALNSSTRKITRERIQGDLYRISGEIFSSILAQLGFLSRVNIWGGETDYVFKISKNNWRDSIFHSLDVMDVSGLSFYDEFTPTVGFKFIGIDGSSEFYGLPVDSPVHYAIMNVLNLTNIGFTNGSIPAQYIRIGGRSEVIENILMEESSRYGMVCALKNLFELILYRIDRLLIKIPATTTPYSYTQEFDEFPQVLDRLAEEKTIVVIRRGFSTKWIGDTRNDVKGIITKTSDGRYIIQNEGEEVPRDILTFFRCIKIETIEGIIIYKSGHYTPVLHNILDVVRKDRGNAHQTRSIWVLDGNTFTRLQDPETGYYVEKFRCSRLNMVFNGSEYYFRYDKNLHRFLEKTETCFIKDPHTLVSHEVSLPHAHFTGVKKRKVKEKENLKNICESIEAEKSLEKAVLKNIPPINGISADKAIARIMVALSRLPDGVSLRKLSKFTGGLRLKEWLRRADFLGTVSFERNHYRAKLYSLTGAGKEVMKKAHLSIK